MKVYQRFILALGLVLISGPLVCQDYRIAVIPKKESKWGYMNLKGEMIVPPISWLGLPSTTDGTVLTTATGFTTSPKVLYDREGREIEPDIKVKIVNDAWSGEIFGFRGNMLRQVDGGKWGAINSKGKVTVPFLYDELTDFDDGYALGKRDKTYYVVDTQGGEQQIERNEDITYIKHFSEGLAPIELNNKQFGFVDKQGKIIVEPAYLTVGYFSGGYAFVRAPDNKIGFVDRKGNIVIEPKFSEVRGFDKESGLAIAKYRSSDPDGSYTDTTGNMITFTIAEKYDGFFEGLSPAMLGKKYGYLNNKGTWAIMPVFDDAAPFNNGYAPAKSGKYWGIINTKAEWVLQPIYKDLGVVVKLEEAK